MKTSQMIGAILLLAALVFVVTFAMNYIGEDKTEEERNLRPEESLYFTEKVFPTQAQASEMEALICEVGGNHGHDFWFVNPTNKVLTVEVSRKKCTCSHVDISVLSEKGKRLMVAGYASRLARLITNPWDVITLQAGFYWPKEQEAREFAKKMDLLGEEPAGSVPPGGLGWVRLGWQVHDVKKSLLAAELWIDRPDGPKIPLQVNAQMVPPVQIPSPFIQISSLKMDELPYSLAVLCWSTTRPNFQVRGRLVDRVEGGEQSDPVEIGTPIPLSFKERKDLEQRLNVSVYHGPVLVAYRIPVTLRVLSRDGSTPFDIGTFHRKVELLSPAGDFNPIEVSLSGRVSGEVRVEGDSNGAIRFGSFPRSLGSKELTVTLRSQKPGLDLVLESDMVPAFVEAQLQERPKSGDLRVWQLSARVGAGKARGTFPRAQDPTYSDSAIYVNIVGEDGKHHRRIRVPVVGTATEG
jgi:hypothetical protein